jgi:hypothetical protein
MKRSVSSIGLAAILLGWIAACLCSCRSGGTVHAVWETNAFSDEVALYSARKDWDLVHVPELVQYLHSPQLLQRLHAERLVVYDAERDTASISVPGSTRSLGMVYYTIQTGWHLLQENEAVRHVGKGWLILEKEKPPQTKE